MGLDEVGKLIVTDCHLGNGIGRDGDGVRYGGFGRDVFFFRRVDAQVKQSRSRID